MHLFSRVLEVGNVGPMCYPVLEMSSISWITAELVIVDNISNPGLDECYRVTYVTTLLPEPTMKFKVSYDTEDAEERWNVRFPWIHQALSNS